MQFSSASIQSIKSISQRALTIYWNRLAVDRSFPSIAEFKPEARLHDPKQLVVWAVENDGSQRRFRALYQGSSVGEVFNSAWTGKTMDEVVPASFKSFAIDAANECASSCCAIYAVLTTVDANGRHVDCERLLLPLGHNGVVEQIVASLQLISIKGEFERKNVLAKFESQSQISFAGRIRSGSMKPTNDVGADADVVLS